MTSKSKVKDREEAGDKFLSITSAIENKERIHTSASYDPPTQKDIRKALASTHDVSLKRLREWVENKIVICRQNIDDWEKEPQESYNVQRGIQINKDRIVAFQLVLSEIDKEKRKE